MRAKPTSCALLACAVASLFCVFLPWAQLGFVSVAGIRTDDGKLAALAAVIVGALGIAGAAGGPSRLCGWLAVLPACGIGWIGIHDTIAVGDYAGAGVMGTALFGVLAAVAALILGLLDPEPVPVFAAPVMVPPPGQWAPDPSGRHQHRWWNGWMWTRLVMDNGVTSTD